MPVDGIYRCVMREPTFLIMAAVAPKPMHGYAIMRAVKELSGGRVNLRAGTLYGALDRLVGEGAFAIDREEVVEGRLRRYYMITPAGLDALHNEVDIRRADVAAVEAQLQRRPSLGWE